MEIITSCVGNMCSLGRKFEGYIKNYVVIGNNLGLDSDNDTGWRFLP